MISEGINMKKLLRILLPALAAALLCTAACAEEAADLTQDCKLKSSGTKRRVTLMTDGKYTSYWETNKAKHNYVEIHAPSGEKIHTISSYPPARI